MGTYMGTLCIRYFCVGFCKVNRNPRGAFRQNCANRGELEPTEFFSSESVIFLHTCPSIREKMEKFSWLCRVCNRTLIGKVDHPWPVRIRTDVCKCPPSSVHKCGPLTIFPSVIYTCLLLVSASGTLLIIPREKTRTKIETRRSRKREQAREKERDRKRIARGGGCWIGKGWRSSDAPERVLFSIYGTFRYHEMRLISRAPGGSMQFGTVYNHCRRRTREANERHTRTLSTR